MLIPAAWLIALFLTAVAVSSVVRIAGHAAKTKHLWNAPGWPTVPLLYGCATVIAFTILGALPPLKGAALAVLLAAVLAVPLAKAQVLAMRRGQGGRTARRIIRGLLGAAKAGPRWLAQDVRRLLGQAHRGPEPRRYEPASATSDADPVPPAAAPAPTASRPVPAPREVPSVRDDPALGAPPAPADVAAGLAGAGVPVPPAWAALCDSVATFEPDDDEALIAHVAGEAAGILTYADAVRARAETLLHGTGLDPAYVAGHFEFADEFADLASAVALVDRRFAAIYGAVREWVAGGGILPHNARQWFGIGGAAPVAGAEPGDDLAA